MRMVRAASVANTVIASARSSSAVTGLPKDRETMVVCRGWGISSNPMQSSPRSSRTVRSPRHAHFFPDPFIGQAGQIESGPGTLVTELLGKLPADAPDLANRRHFQILARLPDL